MVLSTGRYQFKKGEQRRFDFQLHITPLKPYDYKKGFFRSLRPYVTFHQGNMIMPYINYPFYEVDRLKKAMQHADYKNIGIKLYYTEREHSNHMTELSVSLPLPETKPPMLCSAVAET